MALLGNMSILHKSPAKYLTGTVGYGDRANWNKPGMMRNIRNLFGRAELTEQEVRSLRGIVSSLTRAHERRKEQREREAEELGYSRQPEVVIVGGGQGGIALAQALLDVTPGKGKSAKPKSPSAVGAARLRKRDLRGE